MVEKEGMTCSWIGAHGAVHCSPLCKAFTHERLVANKIVQTVGERYALSPVRKIPLTDLRSLLIVAKLV